MILQESEKQENYKDLLARKTDAVNEAAPTEAYGYESEASVDPGQENERLQKEYADIFQKQL